MKKLSEILLEEQQLIVGGTTPTLILFDDVLDPEKVLQSPEIDKIVNYFFGRSIVSILQPENIEQLHDYFRDTQYRADIQTHAMIYPIKADFGELTLETYSDQFSGPAYIQITFPGDAVYSVLTITCRWNDGLFSNDYYVIGAVIDLADLEKIVHMKEEK